MSTDGAKYDAGLIEGIAGHRTTLQVAGMLHDYRTSNGIKEDQFTAYLESLAGTKSAPTIPGLRAFCGQSRKTRIRESCTVCRGKGNLWLIYGGDGVNRGLYSQRDRRFVDAREGSPPNHHCLLADVVCRCPQCFPPRENDSARPVFRPAGHDWQEFVIYPEHVFATVREALEVAYAEHPERRPPEDHRPGLKPQAFPGEALPVAALVKLPEPPPETMVEAPVNFDEIPF